MTDLKGGEEPHQIELGVWVVVFGELSLFTLFFTIFLYYRGHSPELFESSRLTLHQDLGALNTMILITSSWCVAAAVRALRKIETRGLAPRRLAGALTCGAAFVFVKVIEYGGAYRDGVTVLTNEFYMFYFMLTGIHLFHVLVGMILLVAATVHLQSVLESDGMASYALIGFTSCFWHMLDLVWIVLFPLLYLLH